MATPTEPACSSLTCGACGYCRLWADLEKVRGEQLMADLRAALDPKAVR